MISTALYTLKRLYGKPLQLARLAASTTDATTGIKTQTIQRTNISSAVILPNEFIRQFLSKDTIAKYGAYLDTSKRAVLIANQDMPNGFYPNPEDWFIYQDKGYWIELITDYMSEATVLIGNNVVGRLKYQVIDEPVRQRIVIGDSNAG